MGMHANGGLRVLVLGTLLSRFEDSDESWGQKDHSDGETETHRHQPSSAPFPVRGPLQVYMVVHSLGTASL